MKRFGHVLIGGAGLLMCLLGSQAYADPACTSTISIGTGTTTILQSSLGTGVCVAGGDKIFGNFAFSTLNTTGQPDVAFIVPVNPIGAYTLTFENTTAQNTTVNNFGFEVKVTNPATALITSLQKDFTLNAVPNPTGNATATLTGSTTPATTPISCTRTVNPGGGTCPGTDIFSGMADIVVRNSLTTGANAQVTAVQDTIGQSPVTAVPEPTSLILLGSGLVGLSFVRRNRKSA